MLCRRTLNMFFSPRFESEPRLPPRCFSVLAAVFFFRFSYAYEVILCSSGVSKSSGQDRQFLNRRTSHASVGEVRLFPGVSGHGRKRRSPDRATVFFPAPKTFFCSCWYAVPIPPLPFYGSRIDQQSRSVLPELLRVSVSPSPPP